MNRVSVDRINLKYRDDIALRIYCFINNDFEPYRKFAQKNPHVKHGKVDAEVKKVRSCYEHIKRGGTFPSIKMLSKDGNLYPLEGAKRLSSSYFLNKDVDIKIQPMSEEYRLSKPFNIDCDKFALVSDNIKEMLTARKNIIDIVTHIEADGKKVCCHSISELGIIGEQDCAEFCNTLGDISGKRILDVACKMGMMSIECARRGAIVDGVAMLRKYHQVSLKLQEFFNIDGVNFYDAFYDEDLITPLKKYDIILSSNRHIADNLIRKGEVDEHKIFIY